MIKLYKYEQKYRSELKPPKKLKKIKSQDFLSIAGGDLIFDIECYKNFFLIAFKSMELQAVSIVRLSAYHKLNLPKLRWIVGNFRLIGFNCRGYDSPMMAAAMIGYNNERLYNLSKQIIVDREMYFNVYKRLKFDPDTINQMDIMKLSPSKAGLKTYGCRMGSKIVQDLPYDPDIELNRKQMKDVTDYCYGDLQMTEDLYKKLSLQVSMRDDFRQEYGMNFMCESDSKIAEKAIVSEIQRISGEKIYRKKTPEGFTFKFEVPDNIKFESKKLRNLINVIKTSSFTLDKKGKPMNSSLKGYEIKFKGCTCTFGKGGLHSKEKQKSLVPLEDEIIISPDVVSYYPFAKLRYNISPKHISNMYLKVLGKFVSDRVKAKDEGSMSLSDRLKLIIVSSFGQMGNKYCKTYCPSSFMSVTLLGQLGLLKLVEMVEGSGLPVHSVNTDGIVVKMKRSEEPMFKNVCQAWEKIMNFDLEYTYFDSLFSRGVNDYIAFETGEEPKTKGYYGKNSLKTNLNGYVCTKAVMKHIKEGVPLIETIKSEDDFQNFIFNRKVKGGAEKDGVYIGESIRWYYSKRTRTPILYSENGNKVPGSIGGWPCMVMPQGIPEDIDFDWYVENAKKNLEAIGFIEKKEPNFLF